MRQFFFVIIFLFISSISSCQEKVNQRSVSLFSQSQWHKAKVAYLGDSITDKGKVGTKRLYWEYLEDYFQIESFVFGRNGHTWKDLMGQAEGLKQANISDLSAIVIFAGTNDYNANIPLGTLFSETTRVTNYNGQEVDRKYRETAYDLKTYYGRINKVISYLKEHFPKQQIIILTPLHRGYAAFGAKNVQPDERFANGEGFYIDDYVEALKKVGTYWSIPVIDLFGTSGLYPLSDSHSQYFANKEQDLLHPNASGHERMALTIAYQLLQYPAMF